MKILYKTVGGKELPPNLKRRCTPEKASMIDASLGLMHFSRSTGGLPSLQDSGNPLPVRSIQSVKAPAFKDTLLAVLWVAIPEAYQVPVEHIELASAPITPSPLNPACCSVDISLVPAIPPPASLNALYTLPLQKRQKRIGGPVQCRGCTLSVTCRKNCCLC